jgi:hypothetical protein
MMTGHPPKSTPHLETKSVTTPGRRPSASPTSLPASKASLHPHVRRLDIAHEVERLRNRRHPTSERPFDGFKSLPGRF